MAWVSGYFGAEKAVEKVMLAQSAMDYEGQNRPLILAVSSVLGQGRPAFIRELYIELHDRSLKCSVIPVSGFFFTRATLRDQGQLDRKGAPETIDMDRYFETLRRARGVRRDREQVWHPNHTPMRSDPLRPTRAVTVSTEVIIAEGPWSSNAFSGYASVLRSHVDQIWRLDAERSQVVAEYEAPV